MQTANNDALSTYAKVILHNWPDVIHLFKQLTGSSSSQTDEVNAKFISHKAIQTVISSPYQQWVKNILSSYAKLADYNLQRTTKKEKVIKESIEKHQIKPSMISKQPLDASQLKKLSVNKLESMQKDLGTAIAQQHTDWNDFYQHWAAKIIDNLAECSISLDETECHNIKRYDHVTEVINQINESQLAIDKQLYNPTTFTDYLKLKTIIAIYNANLRQQQSTNIKLINKQMKKSKKSIFTHH